MRSPNPNGPPPPISINSLLKSFRPTQITPPSNITPDEIAFAFSNIFNNQLSPVQTALLLYILSLTGLEQRPDVLAKCANAMRSAAEPVDIEELRKAVDARAVKMGSYQGGLCDIVGTGGDHHSTFNISTTSSILASSLLLVAKHGNRASTSKSGSADVLACLPLPNNTPSPQLPVVTPSLLPEIYAKTNYAFLFAPNFHRGMRHAAPIRKEMPNPTIFNLLGPLTNPVEPLIEARMIGVKHRDLVPVFAEALRLNGARKALVVCGEEDLDEISCAGPTKCARLTSILTGPETEDPSSVKIEAFTLSPNDFGLPTHPLNTVSPGLTPDENASILYRLLSNQLEPEDPILHFVLMNTAALFVVAGVCDGESQEVITEVGPGGGRWKEGVRLARLAVTEGRALEMVERFAKCTALAAGSSAARN